MNKRLCAAACGALLLAVHTGGDLQAATYFSNTLTGFTGDSSIPSTQAALATAGFSVFSSDATPAVAFGAGGASFGTLAAGDDGRNYVRTVDGDYTNANFYARVTFTTTSDDQAVFFGVGSGDTALFGTPDWSTQLASASFWPESGNDKVIGFRTNNDVNSFVDNPVPGFAPGTHRFQMVHIASSGFLFGAIDLNYAGGAFQSDVTMMTIQTQAGPAPLKAADGWPTEPSRIFFGGDDGVTFRDFYLEIPEPTAGLLAVGGVGLGLVRRRRTT